jgi:hypothetical protein
MADIDVKKASREEIEEALKLLAKVREQKAKEKAKMSDPAYKAKVAATDLVRRVKNELWLKKAVNAGVPAPSDAEVDKEIAARKALKG